ncbi:hypothetical protein A3Q56_03383 [Intoshia linei]|uniref:Uncharacterized protein n=1 Tax=Intoshia linei TaxID=1819745 RepID=A0A177B414_9BILA|nr:hypothetical protein A3Q56_03383 [Intoshia linei]
MVAYSIRETICPDFYIQQQKPDLYDELINSAVVKNPSLNAAVFPAVQQYMLIQIYALMDDVSTLKQYRNFYKDVKIFIDLVHHQRMHNVYTAGIVPMHFFNGLYKFTDNVTAECLRKKLLNLQRSLNYNPNFMKFTDYTLNNTRCAKRIQKDFKKYNFYLKNDIVVNKPTFLWFTKFRTHGNLQLRLMSIDEGAFTRHDGSVKRARYVHVIGNMRNYEDDDMQIVQIPAKSYQEMAIMMVKPKSDSFVLDTRVIWQNFAEGSTFQEVNLIYPEINNVDYKIDMKEKFEQMGLSNTFHRRHHNIRIFDLCDDVLKVPYRDVSNYDQEIFIELKGQTLTVETMFSLSDNIPISKTPLKTSGTSSAGSDANINSILLSTVQKKPNNALKTIAMTKTFYLLMYENRISYNPKDLFSACKKYNKTVNRMTSNNAFLSVYIDDPFNLDKYQN